MPDKHEGTVYAVDVANSPSESERLGVKWGGAGWGGGVRVGLGGKRGLNNVMDVCCVVVAPGSTRLPQLH